MVCNGNVGDVVRSGDGRAAFVLAVALSCFAVGSRLCKRATSMGGGEGFSKDVRDQCERNILVGGCVKPEAQLATWLFTSQR